VLDGDDPTAVAPEPQSGSEEPAFGQHDSVCSTGGDSGGEAAGVSQHVGAAVERQRSGRYADLVEPIGQRARRGDEDNLDVYPESLKRHGKLHAQHLGPADPAVPQYERYVHLHMC
jgi:hypothetical protein